MLVQEKGKAQLRLLATSHGLNHVYQLLTPVIIPEITSDYALSDTTAGLLLACFAVSYALLPVLAGYLSTILGRRRILTLGFVTSSLAFAAMAVTDNIAVLALLFFMAGVGGATYHPNGVPILAEIYPTSRGRTLGLHQTGGALGSVIGPLATGALVLGFTWRPALVVLAVPGLVLAATLWFKIPSEHTPKKTESDPVRNSARAKVDWKTYAPIAVFFAAAYLYVLGLRGTDAFAAQYFVYGRGMEFITASILFSTLKVAGLFSAPLCGWLSDRYNRKKVLAALVIVESASLYAITITPTMLLAIPCIIFGFAAFGLLGVGEALLADITPPDQLSKVFGWNFTLSFSSSIILAPALGFISDNYTFNLGFLLLSAIMPLSILLILKIKTKPTQQKQCPRLVK